MSQGIEDISCLGICSKAIQIKLMKINFQCIISRKWQNIKTIYL